MPDAGRGRPGSRPRGGGRGQGRAREGLCRGYAQAKARALIARIPPLLGEDEMSRLIRFEAEAADLIADHWPAVEAVAGELSVHGTLSGTRVREIMEGVEARR